MSHATRIASRALLSAIALFGAAGGCATTQISDSEIPDTPIAFVHYDAEATRRRAEQAERELEQRTGQTTNEPRQGVGDMNEFASFIREHFGLQSSQDDRMMGRLAFLHPRTGEVEIVENARIGAVPQDWSADGSRLLFSQVVHDDVPQLFELDVASGETRRLTYGRTAHPEGCYGPEGSVVFTSVDTSSGRPEARIMWTGDAGKTSEQISPPGYSYYPTCAPDGSAVAFTQVSGGRNAQRIYIRSPIRTGEPRVLTRGGEASFSADGEWLVFSAPIGKEWTLWRIRPDGTGRTSLGNAGLNEHRPTLSRDARFVVYVADTFFHRELYIRRVDGSGNRVLYNRSDGDRPVW